MPFYNVEPYIEECIRSLYKQDIPLSEYEVICVDDCSPDGSREIVERLQKEYPSLKLLIHEKNKRQGGARNTGLIEAQGQYIWFVDADDILQQNCLARMMSIISHNNLDLLRFHLRLEGEAIPNNQLCSDVYSGSEMIFDVDDFAPIDARCCSSVSQIIKKKLLIEHSIRFAENVQFEDDDYAYQLYAYANRVMLISDQPYIVRQSPNSTTRRKTDLRRISDLYFQSLRLIALDSKLSHIDGRWHDMIQRCVKDSINNLIFRMLKGCSFADQMHFWFIDRTHVRRFKPYLSRKSYRKLCSYVIWRILQ